jgi:nucleoside-diphosphate-sugar epimerase
MAILVTGGAGYRGSVTVERLRSRGESAVVLIWFEPIAKL